MRVKGVAERFLGFFLILNHLAERYRGLGHGQGVSWQENELQPPLRRPRGRYGLRSDAAAEPGQP